MTQEKELLLKDLCARLPYGVFISYDNGDEIETKEMGIASLHDFMFNNAEVKPYLRPMSSMTEEEYHEFHQQIYKGTPYSDGASYNIYEVTGLNCDWLNKKMFDYRGLIPMGLALEASEEMYK